MAAPWIFKEIGRAMYEALPLVLIAWVHRLIGKVSEEEEKEPERPEYELYRDRYGRMRRRTVPPEPDQGTMFDTPGYDPRKVPVPMDHTGQRIFSKAYHTYVPYHRAYESSGFKIFDHEVNLTSRHPEGPCPILSAESCADCQFFVPVSQHAWASKCGVRIWIDECAGQTSEYGEVSLQEFMSYI